MERIYCIVIFATFLFFTSTSFGQSTIMELEGTQGGLVLNRLTNLQRNVISNPKDGLVIFNTDKGCLNYFYANEWFELCGVIIPTCLVSPDCPAGSICNNGVCEPDPEAIPCEGTNEPCPPGWICVDEFCAEP